MVVPGIAAVRCAITDLVGSGPDGCAASPKARERHLVHQVRQWAADGVDLVQLREKQLESGELLALARTAMTVLREDPAGRTRLLLNGRPDLALAASADGVHLTANPGELTPVQVRQIFARAGRADCLVSVSCHSLDEVLRARANAADLVLFGPVFEKSIAGEVLVQGLGLPALAAACEAAAGIPVLALGGVTPETLPACLAAGAAGVAAIRLFA